MTNEKPFSDLEIEIMKLEMRTLDHFDRQRQMLDTVRAMALALLFGIVLLTVIVALQLSELVTLNGRLIRLEAAAQAREAAR